MARSLRERAKDWKWWGEQAAHVLLGFAIAAAAFWAESAVWCFVFGCAFSLAREALQWPIESWSDAAVDLAAMIAGAALVFAL